MPTSAVGLGRMMLGKDPNKRAVYPQIVDHDFFQLISWGEIASRTNPSPFNFTGGDDFTQFPGAKIVKRLPEFKKFTGPYDVTDYDFDPPVSREKYNKKVKSLQDDVRQLTEKVKMLEEKIEAQVVPVVVTFDLPKIEAAMVVPNDPVNSVTNEFQCKICDKILKTKRILKKHAKLHSNIKNFICELCSKAFTEKHHLLDHQSKKVCLKKTKLFH